jgi:hypothetical protein
VREYTEVPPELMAKAIFFFGSKRSWIFPTNDSERKDSLRQPTKYLEFPEDFKALILQRKARDYVTF